MIANKLENPIELQTRWVRGKLVPITRRTILRIITEKHDRSERRWQRFSRCITWAATFWKEEFLR
jgi:hypothetical protein